MADNAVEEGARYWAFISYSHKDAAFGRRLHSRLENYVLPARLVGRVTPQGPVPRRLVPIFRDREELPAAHDLSAEVRAALKASRSLVVVCSPSAAGSHWVGREIEVFRALHPDRPILAAVRDGEPVDCFPQALRQTGAGEAIEPLAADFRRGRDGEQLGLLKLVAGIAGVGLDELVQRDAQRKSKRVTAVTAGALVVALLMGLLAAFALNARSEAERQRGEAEGLVEFMLTDLRDRLKGVGRLDVMTAVNERALHYYGDEDLDRLPVDSLERRARILHAMGEDDETRGDLDAAITKLAEAKRTTAALLAEAPNDPQRIYDHAQSEYWVALIDWRRHQFDEAQSGLERYATLANRLLAIDTRNPDWQMEGGYAESNLGTLILRDKDDARLALTHFLRAQEHFEIAQRARPHDTEIVNEIADGYGWIADCQRVLRLYADAQKNRLSESRLLLELLKKDPRNATYARNLLGNSLGFAQIELDRGLPLAAETRLARTYAEAGRLTAIDPTDESLAKRKTVISLFLLLSRIRANRAGSDQDRQLLSDACSTKPIKVDQEIEDFCAIVAGDIARETGNPDATSFDYLDRNRSRIAHTANSERWGINFSRLLSEFDSARRGEAVQ